jgi:hypothetical protein
VLTTRLGWFGAVAYALPILEVWLLTRLSEHGASVLLVALQVLWVLALIGVVHRSLRGSRAFREAKAAAARERAAAATTGTPAAKASSIGSPNPSSSDG